METIDDILEELRSGEYAPLADRIEAAHKREADSIRHAMVILAGIEMEDSANPPRLWTALEDAYDALSDALGTDGDTAADVEEAKASGRHFVVRALGNAAKMREALETISKCDINKEEDCYTLYRVCESALSAPPRNCDVGTAEEQEGK